MVVTASLDELLNTCGPFTPHEAVAIVQQLLAARSANTEEASAPGTSEVILGADGTVRCRAGQASIEGLGRLLDAMLPSSGNGVRVPGALRFTVARACNSTDAAPFASKAALSAALERFEDGRREEVVRQLFVRSGRLAPLPLPLDLPRHDRRSSANASALRRELRKADQRLFESLQVQALPQAPQAGCDTAVQLRARWAAIAGAALLASFAAGYAATELVTGPAEHSVEVTNPTPATRGQSTMRGATPPVP